MQVVLKSADKNDANLAREIHHHRQFLHPHIARLYEVIVTETLVWLVLEWCPGDELYNKLVEGPMEPQKVQRIFTQLVGAVSYVHSKSCVHRDLKLENILLDKHGNVKVVDFGFTREYEGKASYLQTWCGTVCYSAPEMLKGEKYAGEKVDVWSLGIILYALLCGELPFDDDDENTTKARILKEEPKYPETMPLQAKELITAMLSKRPLLRPALSDILTNPWLAEHAPQQQAILKLQQPPPFSTDLEKETLQRMRSAGVDIDMVIENVLAQRCDALAGWWALLIEKEERKAKRRERKRREREAEAKSLRRLSGASGRLEKIAPTIKEAPEEGQSPRDISDHGPTRGRNMKRLSGTCKYHGPKNGSKEMLTNPQRQFQISPVSRRSKLRPLSLLHPFQSTRTRFAAHLPPVSVLLRLQKRTAAPAIPCFKLSTRTLISWLPMVSTLTSVVVAISSRYSISSPLSSIGSRRMRNALDRRTTKLKHPRRRPSNDARRQMESAARAPSILAPATALSLPGLPSTTHTLHRADGLESPPRVQLAVDAYHASHSAQHLSRHIPLTAEARPVSVVVNPPAARSAVFEAFIITTRTAKPVAHRVLRLPHQRCRKQAAHLTPLSKCFLPPLPAASSRAEFVWFVA
jgi:serine/threonine protein kinase